ncbi:hypothetical protein [Thermodesulforhabdus norvegica]|uniref:Type VI secretion system spike protein VgrG3-like C-terminal domain-containing protein n=1 Tax=Thermodesulforhabdus norvegica TaxID=39841 RepID=A0A1I4VSL1_9BACT|nr:hypothetical protein [Thermodesulforhabdus norvegica]SFN04135.1 hypothetical protein SAMN05660836_02443 [Thermodesulforhabdus norvegica]
MNTEGIPSSENVYSNDLFGAVLRRWIKIRQESLFLSVLEDFSRDLPLEVPQGLRPGVTHLTFPSGVFSSSPGLSENPAGQNRDEGGHNTGTLDSALKSDGGTMGYVSAFFESGSAPGAIGYDPSGGTSYGIYQLSSRRGTVDEFLDYLDKVKPEWAERLRRSGNADTGSTRGAFPDEWKAIASENPEEFAKIQHSFIKEKFYEPLKEKIEKAFGWDVDGTSEALREALWSTAVQHGVAGAFRLVEETVSRHGIPGNEQDFLKRLYEARATRFGRLPDRIERAVLSRLAGEKELLLSMMGNEKKNSSTFTITA